VITAILFASAALLGVNPACPPLTPQNVFIAWASNDATCSIGSPAPCIAGVPVQFIPVGFGYDFSCSVHTFAWDFGDGFKDSNKNAVHAFSSPGAYVVTLTIAAPSGSVVLKEPIVINPHRAPRRRSVQH
jgi:hypothetical protein